MTKTFKTLCTAFALTISLFLSLGRITAHEAVDLSKNDGSLTIVLHHDGSPLHGGTLTLYRVGDVVADGADYKFAWVSGLNCTADLTHPENQETADAALKAVKEQNMTGTTVTVDSEGYAKFNNLSVGLYLVEEQVAAEGFEKINPFLISLPQWDGEHYNYDVLAAAKTERDHKDMPTPTPSTPPSTPPELPFTGQLNWPVPVLAGLGMILLLTGAVLRRKSKDA